MKYSTRYFLIPLAVLTSCKSTAQRNSGLATAASDSMAASDSAPFNIDCEMRQSVSNKVEPVAYCKSGDNLEMAVATTTNRVELIQKLCAKQSNSGTITGTCFLGYADPTGHLADFYTYSPQGLDQATAQAVDLAWERWIRVASIHVSIDRTGEPSNSRAIVVNRIGYQSARVEVAREETATVQKYYDSIGRNVLQVRSEAEAIKRFGPPLSMQDVKLDPLPDDAPPHIKAMRQRLEERLKKMPSDQP